MEKKITNNKCHFRGFLNQAGHHSTAAICVSMREFNGYGKSENKVFIGGEVSISDCTRTISLDMDADDEDSFNNLHFKMDQLIKAASVVKEWLSSKNIKKMGWDKEDMESEH